MPWSDSKCAIHKWRDIRVPNTSSWGPIAMREDNAVLDHEMVEWLRLHDFPYNSGYEPTMRTNVDRNTGRKTWEFYTYVRLYHREHAIHFTLVWA